MAKKKAARGEFNMSKEIRGLLEANAELKGSELFEALQEKFPGLTINRNSMNVAYSNARRKLGIRPGQRAVKVRKPAVAAPSRAGSLKFDLLTAAHALVAQAGGADAAIQAIHQLEALQIKS